MKRADARVTPHSWLGLARESLSQHCDIHLDEVTVKSRWLWSTMRLLPFDSHNHVHMGPTPPCHALFPAPSELVPDPEFQRHATPAPALAGMAVMSTHPRDYRRVAELARDLPRQHPGTRIVPAFGVHPWFLHELGPSDWSHADGGPDGVPHWLRELEETLGRHPEAIVGEIGIDGFHFDPNTKELVSPLERQAVAFARQLELAVRLRRPVSIHAVKSFGLLMECLVQVKRKTQQLPPKIYFHAFGGKKGLIDQLLALCGRETGKVYFGFASIINFRSPKTADLVRHIGLERLVLESDHEDAALVPDSIVDCIRFLSEALEQDEAAVIEQTTLNAFDLYGLSLDDIE